MKDYQFLNAPIVITKSVVDGNSFNVLDAQKVPFAKTWEPPVGDWTPTPHKYERLTDLTGLIETSVSSSGTLEAYSFELNDGQFKIDFRTPDESGYYYPLITINQGLTPPPASGTPVIIEYEGADSSGFYRPPYLDFNPLHAPTLVNKFVVVRDYFPSGNIVKVIADNPYLTHVNTITSLKAAVFTTDGSPVPNVWVNWDQIKEIAGGGFFPVSAKTKTNWAGIATIIYTVPNVTAGSPSAGELAKGIQICGSLVDSSGDIIASGCTRLEPGFTYG
jgi:hypothetical protein